VKRVKKASLLAWTVIEIGEKVYTNVKDFRNNL
jgi:hypothetical protein